MKRKKFLEHDFSVIGWALSIMQRCQTTPYGDRGMAIERVIMKLHEAPNPNSTVANGEIDMIIDIYWNE